MGLASETLNVQTRKPRIVSVTPLAVARDSRTFKQASSFLRFGYDSVVIEGNSSDGIIGPRPEFELRCAFPTAPAAMEDPGPSGGTSSSGASRIELPFRVARWVGSLGKHIWFLPSPLRSWLGGILLEDPFRLLADLLYHRDLCRRTCRIMPQADVYYLHSFLQYPAVRKRCREFGKPFIYDAHDLYWVLASDGREQKLSDRIMWSYFRWLERRCVKAASACVTVSPGVAELERQRFGRGFTVVRNAHEGRLDGNPAAPSMRDRLGLDGAFLLVVVGNAKPGGMAITTAIEALALLDPDVHILFLGSGYEPHIHSAIQLGLGSRVHAPGPVPPTQVAGAIRDADLAPIIYWAVTSNFYYCLPNGFFHVVAGSIPVLYPELPEISELVRRYDFGISFDPTSALSFAGAVNEFRHSDGLSRRLRANACAAAEDLKWQNEEGVLQGVVDPLLPRALRRRVVASAA